NTNVLFKSFKTQSSLYKTKENYKLLTKCPHEDISSLMIILSEFGTIQTLKENHISCFSENINRIIENDAIDILSIL
ncbi:MAG: adaptor protein MecA, partial [Oscillospiraceae bacterium]